MKKPKTFTNAEAVIERIREAIFADGRPYHQIAAECKKAPSTIANLASGKTRWPRPETFFPVLIALGLELEVREVGSNVTKFRKRA